MITTKLIYYDQLQFCGKGHFMILVKMRLKLSRLSQLSQFYRRHSLGIMTNCIRNCECLLAYKLRRGQQMFSLYTRLWGESRFKEILGQIRRKVLHQVFEKRKFFVCAGNIILFDWNEHRIPEKRLKEHYSDLEFTNQLTQLTMTCNSCHKRLIVDVPSPKVEYCQCPNAQPVYNKAFGSCPWRPFLERQDVLVWRREQDKAPGLYEYKVLGEYAELRADIFLQVQIDPEYRKEWDATAVEIRLIDSDPRSNSDILYWEMLWPKFFSNREYVFNRRYVVDSKENVIVITNQIVDHPSVPETTDKYRVKEYYCTMVIRPFTTIDKPGLKFCMTYFDNPGLSIPGPIQTWVATTAMPDFLARLRSASAAFTPKSPSEWPGFNDRGSLVFDDFSTVFLVDDSSVSKDLPVINVFKDNCFPS